MQSAPPMPCVRAQPRTTEPALLCAGLFAAVLFSPSLLDIVLAVNLALLGSVSTLHLAAASLARARSQARQPPSRRWAREPFVSVHVVTQDEPAHVVARTLDALSRLEWSAYEVVVVDNGTHDPTQWRPLERLCARLGPRFRFRHTRRQPGRAAALNRCLVDSDPRTELVLVVDPQCRVHPKVLARAARYFDEPGVSHVQFPRAYAHGSPSAFAAEDATWFEVFAPFGQATEAPLLGGSVCLVQRRALDVVGRWSPGALDPEGDLAVRLLASGFQGRYAAEVAGRNPPARALAAVRERRRRAVFADAQTLLSLDARALRGLGAKRALGVLTQLSARFSFLLLPALALPLLAFVPHAAERHSLALLTASAAFPLHLALTGALYVVAPRTLADQGSFARAFVAHLALSWEGATAWLQALFGVRLASGDNDRPRSAGLRDVAAPLVLAGLLAASSGALLYRGQLGAALACVVAAWIFGAVLYVQRDLQHRGRPRTRETGGERQRVTTERVGIPVIATRSQHGVRVHPRHEPDQRPRWHLPRVGDRRRPVPGPRDVQRHGGG